MTGVHLLRAQDRIARSWKNGGGETRDIAVFPPGAGDADFLWRVSVATIAAAGPFSIFPDVDRTFLLLGGNLRITIDGHARTLKPGSAAVQFGGETAVAAAPLSGPSTALNIMTRRRRVSAKLDRWRHGQRSAADALLLIAEENMTVGAGDEPFALHASDALLLSGSRPPLAFETPLLAIQFFCDQLVQ